MNEQNLIKLQHFFEVDIKIKNEMYNMAPPTDEQYIDENSICKYTNNVDRSLRYIFSELKCITLDTFGINSIEFKRVAYLEEKIKKTFYSCGLNIQSLRMFYKKFISDMSIEFINSVKSECVGYSFRSESSIQKAFSVNEVLHFIHSYILNNERILESVPLISEKNNSYNYPISLRGYNNTLFEELFYMFPEELDVGWTDMVIINESKLIMMVRDRGHALTIEITINDNTARLDYFIPKLCNIEMINALPGVNHVNEESIGATGAFEVEVNDLPNALYSFISKVPTDSDMVFKRL